jgi:ABC-type uncharacterized transport system involved in gliding motility auxiliary subunit
MSEKTLGALGWAGIACVAGGVVVRMAMPEQEEVWFWSLIAGIVIISVYGIAQWRDLLTFFSRRQARYGALASSSIVLALGILVAVNFVLARQNKRWDLTAARQYSLADQTVQILESLESPLGILVFARDIDFPRYQDRLGEYAYRSSQVTLEFIDVDKDPVAAREYEVQAYGTIVLEYEDRIERVVSDEEQDLTNALIKVIEGEEQRVYFVEGHGERSTDGEDRDGYKGLSEALRLDNLTVSSVVLAQTGEVPEDASVVVVAGPSNDLLPGEVDVLRDYLESAGKLLVLLDPQDDPVTTDQSNLISLISEWGIEVGNDVVVDASGVGQLLGTDATVPVAATYPPHPITENFELLTAFPLARSITPVEGGANGRTAQMFIRTSERSWAETSMDELAGGEVAMDDADSPGPVSIGAAVSVAVEVADEDDGSETEGSGPEGDDTDNAAPPQARLAVIGDSDFASNSALGIQGNRDLALNTINWLAQQENLISIRPRQPEDRRITLTAAQQFNVLVVTWLIPFAAIVAGAMTWWRRR